MSVFYNKHNTFVWRYTLLIHGFHTFRGGNYIYDAYSNRILRADLDSFQRLTSLGHDSSINNLDYIAELAQKHNVLSEVSITKLDIGENTSELCNRILHRAESINLNVTESCNLRCRYCVYSGSYLYQRTHTSRHMSHDTARRALDMFAQFSEKSNRLHIGFFGGEPLLHFDLIKYCIEYARTKFVGKELSIGLTTNGTLLDDRTTDYLAQNDIVVFVSLDGPKEIHDANRTNLADKGSFDTILRNLTHLSHKHPDYYRTRVGFSIVLAPPIRLLDVSRFFEENELVRGHHCVVSFMRRHDLQPSSDLSSSTDYGRLENDWGLLGQEYVNHIVRDGRSDNKFLDGLFLRKLLHLHSRPITRISDRPFPNGICIPGNHRIFVQVDGALYPCERVVGKDFYLGDIHTGIQINRVMDLISQYCEISHEDCGKCWAVRLCESCFLSAQRGDQLDLERKRENCNTMKGSLHEWLVMYASILEGRPEAFDEIPDAELLT